MPFDTENFMKWEPSHEHRATAHRDLVRYIVEHGEEIQAQSTRISVQLEESQCWLEILETIAQLKQKPNISNNSGAMGFLAVMEKLASPAWGSWELADVLQPLIDQINSEKARHSASQKNLEPRSWVISEWASRSDKNQGKAAFSRQYAPLVKKQFGVIVNPDTIARDWLPRGTKKNTK